jgi:hypothetical protein
LKLPKVLLKGARRHARKEKTTLRALMEQGLRNVLNEKKSKREKWKWKPVTFRGDGLTEQFKNAPWEKIRDELYKMHGA